MPQCTIDSSTARRQNDSTTARVDSSTSRRHTVGVKMLRYAVALVALVALTACGGDDSSGADSTSADATTTVAAAPSTSEAPVSAVTVPAGYSSFVTDDGRTRTYKVVDLSNGEEDVPMVLVVHGFGGSAEAMSAYTGIEAALAEAGVDAVVVYPNGSGADEGSPQSWNAGGCCPFAMYGPIDDVGFFSRLISTVEADYSTDPDEVWMIGHSNGGMMAYRLACEVADKISAIGVAAGALMVDTCAPSRPINVLHLHGELDAVVPLNGGDAIGIVFPPTRESVDRYADAAGCDPASAEATNAIDRACGAARVSLVVDKAWTHDWQPDWSRRFVDFFVATSRT